MRERFQAAVATGCSRVSVSPLDVARAQDAGVPAREIGAWARDLGLTLVLDPVLNWSPGPIATQSRFGRFTMDESLSMARELGVVSMSAIGPRAGDVTTQEMVEPFARLCDAAGEFGALVHVEFIPMTRVPSLRQAWEIVWEADRDNGGVLIDSWHYFRGDPDREVLLAIPGERVLAVQVDDAPAVAGPDLWQDTRERLLPGEGELDLSGLLGDLARIGGLGCVGPEVLSASTTEQARRDPVGTAQRAVDRVRALVDVACGT